MWVRTTVVTSKVLYMDAGSESLREHEFKLMAGRESS
jgi:hypothetical protein